MTFEALKTIAAFGGLGLGVINLAITIYKEFLKRPSLSVEVERADIRWRGNGDYDFKIDISMTAKNGDVYVKDMFIQHPTEVFGPNKLSRSLYISKLARLCRKDLINLEPEEYVRAVKEIFLDSVPPRDLCISDGERKSFTITDQFSSERLMDGWQEVPLARWSLVVDYGSTTLTCPFRFTNNYREDNHAFIERGS
ncbi:MAG: hypothetical protein ACPW60_07560 [Methylohalobius sp. ZOD2]